MTLSYQNLSELPVIAQSIISFGKNYSIWAFYGEMGIGKTTLIREIVKQLGSTIEANSPTFSIMNEYPLKDGTSIYHVDFYRLHKPEELSEIGFSEYIHQNNRCLIEWPEIAEPFLYNLKIVKINMTFSENGKRLLSLHV
jgi:tRNA threonylcarbamoyladenosine biosynthesis protein TsaE